MLPDILPLKPYFREMIWGGRGLRERYNKPLPSGRAIGESWEVSAYPDMESTVAAGPLSGWTLGRLVQAYGGELLGGGVLDRYNSRFPLLIKLLDARQDLSIQVHPDDRYARLHGLGHFGKMEAWYVLHSDGGRIACGLKEGIDRAAFRAAIEQNRVEDAVEFFHARSGDVLFLPPGTVHALCRGVMVYEVQQSSDLTFRIYDYNRPGPDGKLRELHIDRALDVIAFGGPAHRPAPWHSLPGAASERALLVESEHFSLERFAPAQERRDHPPYPSFAALTLLEGKAELAGQSGPHPAQRGDTVLIPAGRAFTISRRNEAPLEYLIASVPA